MKLPRLAALAVAAGLAACGVDRGGTPAGTPPRNPAPPAASTGTPRDAAVRRVPEPAPSGSKAATAAAAAAAAAACSLAPDTGAVLTHINRLRAAGADCRGAGRFGAAPALTWNAALSQAAAAHSRDMAAHDRLSHAGSNGGTMPARATAAGYGWLRIAENIAAGPAGTEAVIDTWMRSDGHCANLMNPDFRDAALACAPGKAGSAYGTYWTMVLGRSR